MADQQGSFRDDLGAYILPDGLQYLNLVFVRFNQPEVCLLIYGKVAMDVPTVIDAAVHHNTHTVETSWQPQAILITNRLTKKLLGKAGTRPIEW